MNKILNNTDDLASYLQKKRDISNQNITGSIVAPNPTARLTADKSADIDDFVEMLSKICSKVMKKMKVEFKPDEGIRLTADQLEAIEHPYILFKILRCEPVKELKPRIRQDNVDLKISDKTEELTQVRDIWGQHFLYLVQFDILAGGYKQTTEVMKIFEDIVFSYTAYFKQNGVKDIRFSRRITDSNLDMYRQKCSVRSLQYEVDIEKLFTRFEVIIDNIAVF